MVILRKKFRNENQRVFVLLDVFNVLFRVFFGNSRSVVPRVASILTRIIDKFAPTHIAAALDSKRSTSFRRALYPQYKLNRKQPPSELVHVVPRVRQLIRLFNIRDISCDGFEADDIIATILDKFLSHVDKAIIVSTDKDLYQLVTDRVVVYDVFKNKILGVDDITSLMGVPPIKVNDLLSLAGDSSDGVPGVPGVGVKTAAKLLNRFGSLEKILSEEEVECGSIIENKEMVLLSKNLVTLRKDVPLDVRFDDFKFFPYDAYQVRFFIDSCT